MQQIKIHLFPWSFGVSMQQLKTPICLEFQCSKMKYTYLLIVSMLCTNVRDCKAVTFHEDLAQKANA